MSPAPSPRPFPPALPHGPLRQVLSDIYFVTGTVVMPGLVPLAFSRNMTVVRQGDELVLINTVRLDADGLRALDALGAVKHVIRIAGFHGMDDPFYKDRYNATVWALSGQGYGAGFNATVDPQRAYFHADRGIEPGGELPLQGASLYSFGTTPPEGLLLLPRDGGVLVAGDALQNWGKADAYFNLMARVMMRGMGFLKPYNLGPGWLRAAKPTREALAGVLDLGFEHLLPAHGAEVLGGAKQAFRPVIERACGR